MGQTLLHKRSGDIINGQPKLPTAEDLKHGEIAINYADGAERISFKNSNNEIVSLRTDDFYEGEFDKLAKADSDLDSKINAVDKSAYKKPVNGIPFEDLASAVQASLNMADTAIQPNTLANYDFINRIQLGVELNKLETAIDTKTDDKIDDVLAIVTENEQVAANALTNLDNRTKALEEATVEVDTQLSMTSQMPVANATITAELNKKIDADDAVALADFNTAMAGKQDKIDNLNEIIAGAALGKTALQPSSLDSYITDGEVNILLDKKADKSDVPTEATVTDWGFTKNVGTVTGVQMNGNTMSMSNGVVNLGTVITNVDSLAVKTEVNANIAKAKDDAIEYADEVKGDIIAIIEENEKVTANGLTDLDERVSAIEGGAVTIEVDSEMSTSSTNPLQNATVTSAINKINSDITEIEGLLSNKQEIITDLATIRSGAAAGATAVQPAALSAYTTTTALNEAISKIDIPDATDIANMGFTKNKGTVTGVKMNNTDVTVNSDGIVNLGTVLTNDSNYAKADAMENALAKKSDTGHTHNYLPLAGGKMDNTTVVTNLNADLLDGKNASAFATSDHNHDSVYYKISDAEAALAKKVDQSTFDTLVGGDASGAIDTFNEITSFLSGITATGDTLQETIAEFETQVNSKSDKDHNHDSVYYKISTAEAALAKKSDTGHTHSQYSVTGHTHDDRYSLTGHTHPYAASAHTHDDRYFTETEVNSALAKKSDTGHTHGAATTAVTGFVKISNGDVASVAHADGLAAGMDHSHSNYSVTGHTHDDRYFTETEVNSALAKKSDTGHTHSAATTAVTGFVKISNGDVASVAHADGLAAGMDHSHSNYSVTGHTHDDRYFTETEVNTALAKKSDTGHTHDDRYFTETEVNNLLAGKSDTGHTHSNYSPTGHTHDDMYFTETEVNSALAKKSDTGHTHSNYSTTGHTHNYAGSSSAGGAATSAAKLTNTTAIGGSTQPVYFNASGVPVACTAYSGASVNYATSAGSANAVAWSNVSGVPGNATTATTGFVKISNGDVASVAHADGLVAGMDHSHGNYSTTAHTHSDYSTTSHTHTFITYSDGMNTGTTVSSIPITKRMYKATVSASGSFSIATGLTAGREVHVIIYNSGSSAITITMPTASTYVNMGDDSITIAAGGYAEVNALSDGSKIYIRNGW